MAVLDIVKYGDPRLRQVCKPIDDFSVLPKVLDDMYDTMYEAEGIGLAANQAGFDMNLFIIDITHTDEHDTSFEFINSKIVESWGESAMEEGCLSVPGVELDVKRPEFIIIQYQTPDGVEHKQEFSGLMARAIQHEMDHLNGRFITDRVSAVVRLRYKSTLKEIKNSAEHLYAAKRKEGNLIL